MDTAGAAVAEFHVRRRYISMQIAALAAPAMQRAF